MADRYTSSLEFLREVHTIATAQELAERFGRVAGKFGFGRITFLLVAEPGQPIRPRVLLGLGSAETWSRKTKAAPPQADPTLQAILTRARAFTWADIAAQVGAEQAVSPFALHPAEELEVLIVPVHSAWGEVCAVALSGKQPDLSEPAMAVLQACATSFAVTGAHLLQTDPPGPAGSSLSRRETQVLVWLSRGKSIPEICQILGISTGTIKTHLERSKTKLGHQATISAILEAARRGWLIDPDGPAD